MFAGYTLLLVAIPTLKATHQHIVDAYSNRDFAGEDGHARLNDSKVNRINLQ